MRAFASFIGLLAAAWCTPALAQAPLSPAREQALKAGDTFRECDTCPEMVLIPPGTYLMGSPDAEADRDDNEGPRHRVTIARAFALAKFELTVGEFAAFAAETRYDTGTVCDVWQDGSFDARPGFSWRNPGFVQTGAHPAA